MELVSVLDAAVQESASFRDYRPLDTRPRLNIRRYESWKNSSDFTMAKYLVLSTVYLNCQRAKPLSLQESAFARTQFTGCSSKGQALQLTSGLEILLHPSLRLWMEHPSRGKVKTVSHRGHREHRGHNDFSVFSVRSVAIHPCE